MTPSSVFQLTATAIVVALIGFIVGRGFPPPGWRRLGVVVALAAEAVLLPLRLLAYTDTERWTLADELQLATFVVLTLLFALCAPTIRDRRAARSSAT